tara:strand:+ start:7557 stop:10055 length:2499 start_codon:yes stop_codon:yes gene_type:complete
MALVQMRTPGGSYSMVDEKAVPIYEAEGWVLTSELPEFKTKDVTYYDESRKTVTSSKGEEKPVEEVIEKTYRLPSITSKKEEEAANNPQVTKSIDINSAIKNSSGKIRSLTAAEYAEFKKLPIEEKRIKISELAAANINFRSSQIEDLEETYRITEEEFNAAVDKGRSGELDVMQSGPLNSGVNTWWQLLGYDTINEVNKDLASGALNINDPEVRRAKDNAEEKRGMGGINDTRKPKLAGPIEFGDIITTVTVFKDGKAIEILESDLHLYELQDWTEDESAAVSTSTSSTDSSTDSSDDSSSDVLTERIGSTQVVVYGPNGARTTANTAKRDGEEMSEYDRLIAGLIEGREGYAGATQTEELTSDYPGDYGGEDASTPDDQRESVVGVGNTDYDNKDYSSVGDVVGQSSSGDQSLGTAGGTVGTPGATKLNQFNNIPEGAVLVQSDEDRLYLMYTVPGAGTLYKGLPLRMFYEVKSNDLYKAGILTQDAPYEINLFLTEEEIDDYIVAGNTAELPGNDPNTGQAPHPFLSFVDNLTTQAQIAPWLLDKEAISLLAEAALEGREVSEAEWRVTDWYQEHSEAEREWLRLYNADPSTATAQKNDYKIQVSRALQAAGVTGGFDSATGQEKAPPDALVSWIADKWVSGTWSESKTSEQIALFADPFKSGIRDTDFTTYLSTAGVDGLERTAEKEDRVRQLYTQYLGPVFGKLSDAEVSQKAGRLRNDTDYEAALIEQLKNNRLGLFPKYTNPELTYEDIVTPWRNLTTSVWGEAADETQSWWQDMVGTNDFTSGTATLRSKGLEMGNNQVTIEATEALQSALGDGSALQNLGANQ